MYVLSNDFHAACYNGCLCKSGNNRENEGCETCRKSSGSSRLAAVRLFLNRAAGVRLCKVVGLALLLLWGISVRFRAAVSLGKVFGHALLLGSQAGVDRLAVGQCALVLGVAGLPGAEAGRPRCLKYVKYYWLLKLKMNEITQISLTKL